jgi:hypothetical protein
MELKLPLQTTLFFFSHAPKLKNLYTTPNLQRLIENLDIDNPLKYAVLALDRELQTWTDAMSFLTTL